MGADRHLLARLRDFWEVPDLPQPGSDYRLLGELDRAYPARTQTGRAALLVPLEALGSGAAGRLASGCELLGHASTVFALGSREWASPAAALVCTDDELIAAFTVLAADLTSRLATSSLSWDDLVTFVEEWQALLTPRGKQSQEFELGLWGELWFVTQSDEVLTALAAWRGPDRDVVDFFLNGKGAEVKTSRKSRQHHVSRSQVENPVGESDSWLLSIWVKVDPVGGLTLPDLVGRILERAADCATALKHVARAGYSPGDRKQYTTAFSMLQEPEWYPNAHVPRIRAADSGVTHLRYRIELDETKREDAVAADGLWRHFHGHSYGSSGE